MKKIILIFLAIATAGFIASAHADKVDDAIKQAEQEIEAARLIINTNKYTHDKQPAICNPGVDLSESCFAAILHSRTKPQADDYVAAQQKLMLLQTIKGLSAAGKLFLNKQISKQNSLTNSQASFNYWVPMCNSMPQWHCNAQTVMKTLAPQLNDDDISSLVKFFQFNATFVHQPPNSLESLLDKSPDFKKLILDALE